MEKGSRVRTSDEFNEKFPVDRHAIGIFERIDDKDRVTIRLDDCRFRIVHLCWVSPVQDQDQEEEKHEEAEMPQHHDKFADRRWAGYGRAKVGY